MNRSFIVIIRFDAKTFCDCVKEYWHNNIQDVSIVFEEGPSFDEIQARFVDGMIIRGPITILMR